MALPADAFIFIVRRMLILYGRNYYRLRAYMYIVSIYIYDQIEHVLRALALYILYAYTVHNTSIRSI